MIQGCSVGKRHSEECRTQVGKCFVASYNICYSYNFTLRGLDDLAVYSRLQLPGVEIVLPVLSPPIASRP